MTLNGAIQGNFLKIQLMQKGSLLLLAAMASLFLAFQRHKMCIRDRFQARP